MQNYGLGIVGYFSFLEKLIGNMCCWSIFAIAIVCMYKAGGHLSGTTAMYDAMAQMSLGNLEGATTKCLQNFYGIKNKHTNLTCSKGIISNYNHIGVIAYNPAGLNL